MLKKSHKGWLKNDNLTINKFTSLNFHILFDPNMTIIEQYLAKILLCVWLKPKFFKQITNLLFT